MPADLKNIQLPRLMQGDTLEIRANAGASRNGISVDSSGVVKVSVTTVAEGGKANAAILKLLSKALGVPKSHLKIVRGQTSRNKCIKRL